MKSLNIHKRQAKQKLKNNKKENAMDVISKYFSPFQKGSVRVLIFNSCIMSNIKNYVHLLGRMGDTPKVTTLDKGKKMARFSMATNEYFYNSSGEKVQNTQWHSIITWGKTAEIVESYATKGQQLVIVGKLNTRAYTPENSNQKVFITEVIADEILLLSNKNQNA